MVFYTSSNQFLLNPAFSAILSDMYRYIFDQLKAWKQSPNRKPLILMGARQVGKTYALQAFAEQEFASVVYLNFESNSNLNSIFAEELEPQELLKLISIESRVKIVPEETLIIFDEIQESPRALNSLKYFCETASEYHICAAGSLLGVKLANTKGFPVGKVNFLSLTPLSFTEFLIAMDEQQLCEYLQDTKKLLPIAEILHKKLLKYLRLYLYIGGMPEAVKSYKQDADLEQVRDVQKSILKAYELDFVKHAPENTIMKINQVWDSIPSQLAKENKKFIYSVIRKGARAVEFEAAIQWLTEAGLIHKVYNVATPKLPLKAYAKFAVFKLYLVDVGLLGAMVELSARTLLDEDRLFQEFNGALLENYVAQALAHEYENLYYWTSEGKAELDYILQFEDQIYPLEIKSGNSGKKKSLQVYGEKFKPELLLRSSPMNLKHDGKILNCPLYMIELITTLIANAIHSNN